MSLIDTNATVRDAAYQFFEMTGEDHQAMLLNAALESNSKLGVAAARILLESSHHVSKQILLRLLTARNLLVADVALCHLEHRESPVAALSILIEALTLCEPLIQINIVNVIGRLGCPNAVQPLMRLLVNTEWTTLRYVIIEALGLLGDREAASVIDGFCNDADDHVRQRARDALRRLKSPRFIHRPESIIE